MRVSRAERLIGHVLGGYAGDGRQRLDRILARAKVTPEHFANGRARLAWAGILAAHRKHGPIDLGAILDGIDEQTVDGWIAALWLKSFPAGCDHLEAEEIAAELLGRHDTESTGNSGASSSDSFDVDGQEE